MTGETVVVTGAAGFIGRWVIATLLDQGYKVHGVDNLSSGQRENVRDFAELSSFSLHEVDIRNADELKAVFDNVDDVTACIHLAAEIDVHESLEKPQEHFETNVVGTQNVLEVCRRTTTRLTVVGTCMVYDVSGPEGAIEESHPVKPASPYAGSKLAAENIAESYYHGYDLPVTILRPFNTYGPYQRAGADGGVISIFLDRDLRDETLQIYGDGTQTRDLLYVTDCARFIVDATFSAETVGEVINAGTGKDVSINELAKEIASDGTDIEHVEHHHPQSEISRLRCDPSKAQELLGWEPEVTLAEGINTVRTWLTERHKR